LDSRCYCSRCLRRHLRPRSAQLSAHRRSLILQSADCCFLRTASSGKTPEELIRSLMRNGMHAFPMVLRSATAAALPVRALRVEMEASPPLSQPLSLLLPRMGVIIRKAAMFSRVMGLPRSLHPLMIYMAIYLFLHSPSAPRSIHYLGTFCGLVPVSTRHRFY